MLHAEIRLGNGDVYTVEGTLDEVERGLSDAARSGQARLAWFKERGMTAQLERLHALQRRLGRWPGQSESVLETTREGT